MRCDVAQLELSARMDGERNERLDRSLQEHLAACSACRRFGSGAEEVRRSVRLRPAAPVPDLVVDVMRVIEDEPQAPQRRRRTTAAIVAGIAAIAIVAAGLALLDRQTPPEPLSALTELRARTLLAWTPGEVTERFAHDIAALDGVAAITRVRSGIVWIDGASGRMRVPVEVAAVDPDDYARFVPARERALLSALRRGEVVLGDRGAELRGMRAGGTLRSGPNTLDVTGVVDDATIGVHEAVVSVETARDLGIDRVRYVLVELDLDASAIELRRSIEAASGRTPARVRALNETPRFRHGDAVLSLVELKELFGEFAAEPASDGALRIDPAWTAANIVTGEVPVLGRVRCHRLVVPPLEKALGEIVDAGLADLIDDDFGGCFSPRFLSQDEGAGISHHSWGVAFDINVADNPFGEEPTLDPRIVEIFERKGFTWGGRWLVPDGMHFEFRRSTKPQT